MLAEEVLFILCVIACGDGKGLACTLGIVAGDDRCVYINKSLILEELMNRHGQRGTDTEHCGQRICARTQMSDLTQVFKRMTLLLKRIRAVTESFDYDLGCLDFKRLFVFRGRKIFAGNADGSACKQFSDFRIVCQRIGIHDLCILKIGSVIQRNKADVLSETVGADPSLQGNIFHLILFHIGSVNCQFIQFSDRHITQHVHLPLFNFCCCIGIHALSVHGICLKDQLLNGGHYIDVLDMHTLRHCEVVARKAYNTGNAVVHQKIHRLLYVS